MIQFFFFNTGRLQHIPTLFWLAGAVETDQIIWETG
jgi:hypothetical protein